MATRRGSTATRSRRAPGLKRDYSNTEYRETSIYDGPEPTKGIYRLELVHVGDYTKQGEDEPSSVQWTFRAMEGEENKHGDSVAGWKSSKYTTEAGAFVEQNILVACQVIKPGQEIDMSYDQILKKAKPCRALVVLERYIPENGEPEWRAVLTSNFLPDDGGASTKAKARQAADDEDEDDDEDEPPARSSSRRGRRAEPEPEPEEDEDEDTEEEDGDDEDLPTEEELQEFAEELEGLKLAELKDEAKKYGVVVKRGQKADAIIDAILDKAADEGFVEEEEDEPEEEEPEPPKATRGRRGTASTRTSSAGSKRGGKRGYDDDPPF